MNIQKLECGKILRRKKVLNHLFFISSRTRFQRCVMFLFWRSSFYYFPIEVVWVMKVVPCKTTFLTRVDQSYGCANSCVLQFRLLGALVSWCPVFHACILEDIEIIYEKLYVMLGDMFHVTLHNIEAREPGKSLVAIFRNTTLGPQLAEVSLRWLFLQLCRLWSSYSHAENSGPS